MVAINFAVSLLAAATMVTSAVATPLKTVPATKNNLCTRRIGIDNLSGEDHTVWANAIKSCTDSQCRPGQSAHPNKDFLLCVAQDVEASCHGDDINRQVQAPAPRTCHVKINTSGLNASDKEIWDDAIATCREKVCKPHTYFYPNKAFIYCLGQNIQNFQE